MVVVLDERRSVPGRRGTVLPRYGVLTDSKVPPEIERGLKSAVKADL